VPSNHLRQACGVHSNSPKRFEHSDCGSRLQQWPGCAFLDAEIRNQAEQNSRAVYARLAHRDLRLFMKDVMQFSTIPSRDVVVCKGCDCVQFLPTSGRCVRCDQGLGISYFAINLLGMNGSDSATDDSLRNSIGAALRAMRTRRGITQAALSRQLSIVGRSHLSRIESGRVLPPLHTLLLIVTCLGAESVIVRFRDSPP